MARVRKTVLAVGEHRSPEGVVKATPARLRHWADQFNAMRAAGLKIPVPYGHNTNAIPADPNDPNESQFLSSRYNAGYVEALDVTPDGLVAANDCPGLDTDDSGNLVGWAKLPDGREVKTAIGEVSVGIAKKFTDGTGRVWNDVITHIAVTPHPVWGGQDGFTALGGSRGRVEGLVTLALGGATMNDDAIFDDDLDAPPPADVLPDPNADAGTGEITMEKLLPALAEHGIALPEGTDDANFIERLYTAIVALQGKLTPAGGAPLEDPAAEQTPVTQQEPDAVLMSLLGRTTDAREKAALQATIDERKAARQATRDARAAKITKQIERHAGAGIPRDVLTKHFGAEPAVQCLSLLARPATAEVAVYEGKLALLKDLKPYLVGPLKKQLAKATEVVSPIDAPDREQKAVTERMAKAVGC